ncbi:MAG: RagB/SusD family nutrient uptake outer membrane protein, partial [Bacteroidaceae bacterium]|nr:RagB/SusD family nutrient uptake outer membrane protein [Bacteroidaceae bacterium]
IIDENGYCNWGIYYEAINYANLLLEDAPKVVESDPDFSEGDLAVVMGEMYAMRALCHFYLVRTFRDIPLALKSAKNDAEIPNYVQVKPLEALDQIMEDLNRAENMVMKSGAFSTEQQNLGRITRNAVLAIKADVNLWRAAFAEYEGKDADPYYNECIDNCEDIIANMDKALDEDNKGKPVEKYAYNLIQNRGEAKELSSSHKSTAYDEIFGSKNSSESIFELQVQGDNIKNGAFNGVYRVYGTEGNPGLAVVPQGFVTGNYEEDDLRAYSFTNLKSFNQSATDNQNTCIVKYAAKASPATSFRKSDEWDANWIVYRRTDVLLMKAEAMVARSTSGEEDFRKAFDIVNAINTRSRIDSTDIKNPLKVEKYLDKEASLELIRKERLLELSYEGKRWFDLVRLALREKSTDKIKFVADKLGGGAAVVYDLQIKIRLWMHEASVNR